MKDNENSRLVQQTLDGGADGFNRLMRKYQSIVYGIAYHWTKNFAEAQDLTQEAFLHAYQNLDSLRNPNKFESWLRQITTNLCRMWARG